MILIRLKGVANDEAGDEDDRVMIVVPEGPLEKLNWDSANPKTEEAETRDSRSPRSEADPRPVGHCLAVLYIERKRVEGRP